VKGAGRLRPDPGCRPGGNGSLPAILATVILLQGCGDSGPLLFPDPVVLAPGSDPALEGQVGEELLPAPEVELRDARGNPVPGVEVTFVPGPGSGRIAGTPALTDARGVARARGWILGEEMGIQQLGVQAADLPPLALEVKAGPGPPARLEPVEEPPERVGRVGDAVEPPPAVRLVDRFGNPIASTVVGFDLQDGGSLQPASAITDAQGLVRLVTWTLGTRAGLQTLRATFGRLEPAIFSAHARPGPPAELARKDEQIPSGVVGLPLATPPGVRVLDRFGNPVPEILVRFRTNPGYGTVSPAELPSDSLGTAAPEAWTLGPVAGTQLLRAGVDSLPTFQLEALARAGVAAAVEAESPLEQEAFVDSIVSHPPTVRVLDEFGNAVEGVEVAFQVTRGGGTVSGSPATTRPDGLAWAASWRMGPEPGPNQMEARVGGIPEPLLFHAAGLEAPRFDLIVEGMHLNQGSQRNTGGIAPVAGRPGVLRVVVRSTTPTDASPPVRIRVRQHGLVVREELVHRSGAGVPMEPDLTVGTETWNLPLQPHEIQPGVEVQVEVDPEELLEVDRRDTNRYPRSGGFQSLAVVADSPFRVRFIPVHQSASDLTGRVHDGNAASFLDATWRLLPLGALDWAVRSAFTTDAPALEPSNENGAWSTILSEIQALRVAEGATDEYYYGVVQWPFSGGGIAGIGYILPDPSHPARSALGFDREAGRSVIMAHELGHTLGRRHAPCGGAGGVDPFYPYAGALLGAAGWDVVQDRFITSPDARDLMGYCSPVWVSDYTFGAIRAWRRGDPLAAAPASVAAPLGEVLLVWGRVDSRGPVLEPAFQVEGRALEPEGSGPHRITLLDGDGRILYRRSFAGTEVEHAEDPAERHFAFLVPLDGTAGAALAALRLETPFGTAERRLPPAPAPGMDPGPAPRMAVSAADRAELEWDGARFPMALVRDRSSGTILGLVREGGGQLTLPPGRGLSDLQLLLSDGVRSVEVDPR
jgi:predicted small lipoprotein YifL